MFYIAILHIQTNFIIFVTDNKQKTALFYAFKMNSLAKLIC